jgi:hypothetical protein
LSRRTGDYTELNQKLQQAGVKGITLRQDPNIGEGVRNEMLRRIILCRGPIEDIVPKPNCIGAALFIGLEINRDQFIDINTAYSLYLEPLKKIEFPRTGCMVAWTVDLGSFISVEHMGIVTATGPYILVTHRRSRGGIFIEDQPIEVAGGRFYQLSRSDEYGKGYCKEEFFLPKALNP